MRSYDRHPARPQRAALSLVAKSRRKKFSTAAFVTRRASRVNLTNASPDKRRDIAAVQPAGGATKGCRCLPRSIAAF
jgi:hypothetical protein